MAELSYREAVARGIAQEMARDPDVVFLGEDIGKAGRVVQKTTIDLKEADSGDVEISYTTDANIVGKLAMFGDRIMRAKAKKVEEEFTQNLRKTLEGAA